MHQEETFFLQMVTTKAKTPLLLHQKTEAEIIRLGLSLGLDYGLTTSCYDPDSRGRPCGRCDSCLLREAGFAAVGETDPRASL
jgi:7-cyano-7-deazaguanine synthase